MPILPTLQSAYATYQNRDKAMKILKWVTLAMLMFFFVLYIIIASIITVIQSFGKVSQNTQSLELPEFAEFTNFNYKTVYGETWYSFNHAYTFPTLGVLTQGVLMDSSAKVGKIHVAWDIADRQHSQTEVRSFAGGVVESIRDNILENTTRRWKFCEDNESGICWYQVKEEANVQYGCGYEVIIAHPDNLRTQYCHLQTEPQLKVGDTVTAGQLVGIQGLTGWATGKHLHFAIWRDGQPVNPAYAFTQTSLRNWEK